MFFLFLERAALKPPKQAVERQKDAHGESQSRTNDKPRLRHELFELVGKRKTGGTRFSVRFNLVLSIQRRLTHFQTLGGGEGTSAHPRVSGYFEAVAQTLD